jgi:hypothetical protein
MGAILMTRLWTTHRTRRTRLRPNGLKSGGANSLDPRKRINRSECAVNRAVCDDSCGESGAHFGKKGEFADVCAINVHSMGWHINAHRP